MGLTGLDQMLGRFFGRITPDPAERRNIWWQIAQTLVYTAAIALYTGDMSNTFLLKRGVSTSWIGVVASIGTATTTIAMFAYIGICDRIQRRIRVASIIFVVTGLLVALYGVLASVPKSLLPNRAFLSLVIPLLTLSAIVTMLGSLLDYPILVRTIRSGIRGRVWGIAGGVSALLSAGLVLASAFVLRRLGFPLGFSALFVVAAVLWVGRALAYKRLQELPDIAVPGESRSLSPFTAMADMIRLREFRMVAYPHVLRGILSGAAIFIVPTAIKDLPNEYAGYSVAVVTVAGLLGAIAFGLTNDRWGSGIVTFLGEVAAAGAWIGIALGGAPWLFLLLLLVFHTGRTMEDNSIPLGCFEIIPTKVMGAFTTARLMVMTGAGALGSLAAGFLLANFDLTVVFIWFAVFRFGMGLWFLKVFGLGSPTAKKAEQAV